MSRRVDMDDHGRSEPIPIRSDHGRTELEVEELHPDQNGLLPGPWLCCIPCYWLKRNNGFEKALLTIATLLVTVLLVASPVIFLISSVPGEKASTCSHKDCTMDAKGECQQDECLAASRRLSAAMSWGRDPCQDFYQFACGALASRTSSEGLEPDGSFVALQDVVTRNIQQLLAVAANSEPFQKLGYFYKTCLRAGDAKISFTPMLALLKELGGYLPPGGTVPRDLTSLLLRLMRINGAPLFQMRLDQDLRNSSKYTPYIDLPKDSLFQVDGMSRLRFELSQTGRQTVLPMTSSERKQSREFGYLMAALEERRLLTMEKVLLEMLPENMTTAERTSEVQSILHFASTLTKLYPTTRPKLSPAQALDSAITVAELQEKYPFLQWKSFLSQAFQAEFSLLDSVYLLCPQYIQAVQKIVPHFDERIIHNGLLVVYGTDVLYPLINASSHNDWSLFCTQLTVDLFKESVSALFVSQFLPQQLDQLRMRMSLMFEAVKRTLESRLRAVSWVDETSRTAMLNKLAHLHGQFLSWPHFRNVSYISSLIQNVRVDPEDFFGNIIRRYGQLSSIAIGVQDEKPEPSQRQHPFVVNAFYVPSTNTMMIPLAVLVQPHFHAAVPQYIPYATVGQIFAHEVLHAFDLVGGSFNHYGELEPLLTPTTAEKLENKLDCIVSQFSDSFLKSKSLGKSVVVHFNWNATRNENMADINGIEIAFQTWASEVDVAKEQTLPGLPFTHQQLFFLYAAQMYCSNLTPEMYILHAQRDTHAPYPERVNGMMMNSPGFSAAYKCRLGSYMNPKRKCTIW